METPWGRRWWMCWGNRVIWGVFTPALGMRFHLALTGKEHRLRHAGARSAPPERPTPDGKHMERVGRRLEPQPRLSARALTSLGGLKSPRQPQWKKLCPAIGLRLMGVREGRRRHHSLQGWAWLRDRGLSLGDVPPCPCNSGCVAA